MSSGTYNARTTRDCPTYGSTPKSLKQAGQLVKDWWLTRLVASYLKRDDKSRMWFSS